MQLVKMNSTLYDDSLISCLNSNFGHSDRIAGQTKKKKYKKKMFRENVFVPIKVKEFSISLVFLVRWPTSDALICDIIALLWTGEMI